MSQGFGLKNSFVRNPVVIFQETSFLIPEKTEAHIFPKSSCKGRQRRSEVKSLSQDHGEGEGVQPTQQLGASQYSFSPPLRPPSPHRPFFGEKLFKVVDGRRGVGCQPTAFFCLFGRRRLNFSRKTLLGMLSCLCFLGLDCLA